MNSRKQGDVGVSHAIFWYTKNGWSVSKPLSDATRYDLIIEKNGLIKRVECKTTSSKTKYGIYTVSLRTLGGNQSWNGLVKKISSKDTDIVFVSVNGEIAYQFPIEKLEGRNSVNLSEKYIDYKIM